MVERFLERSEIAEAEQLGARGRRRVAHGGGCKGCLDAVTAIFAGIDCGLGHIGDDHPGNVALGKDQHEFGDLPGGGILFTDQIDVSALTAFERRLFRAAEALVSERLLAVRYGLELVIGGGGQFDDCKGRTRALVDEAGKAFGRGEGGAKIDGDAALGQLADHSLRLRNRSRKRNGQNHKV